MHVRRFRNRTLALATVGALTITGTALAAHPHASKKYAGPTSARKLNGFSPQVTFKVSKDGKGLQNFTYQSTGCFGSGGALKPGVNYLAKPWNEHKLGTIGVSSSGAFSRHHVVTRYATAGQMTTTISTVSGSFKSATKAVGTIRFSQQVSGKGIPVVKPCNGKVTFTATQVKPAPTGGYGGY